MINYIWVGKNRSMNVEQPQHDLIGPLEMNLAINPDTTIIRFWCLMAHMDYYRSLLKDTSIMVESIESFIDKQLDNPEMKQSAENVISLVDRVIKNHYHIRACLTAKEAFAFFIMAAEGGYVLDTNVLPASKLVEFPTYPVFCMPAYHIPVSSRENDNDADVGIMFSPPTNRDYANHALNYFLTKVNEINQTLFCVDYTEEYTTALLHVVIEAALNGHSTSNNNEIDFWRAKRLGPGFPIQLKQPPYVEKHYSNSHSANRGNRSALHDAAAKGNREEVNRLLHNNALIETTISTIDHGNITPLFVAKFYDRTTVIDLLRPRTKSLNHSTVNIGIFSTEITQEQSVSDKESYLDGPTYSCYF